MTADSYSRESGNPMKLITNDEWKQAIVSESGFTGLLDFQDKRLNNYELRISNYE